MNGLFYWTGVVVWGFIASGAVIIMVALISAAVANNLKGQVRK